MGDTQTVSASVFEIGRRREAGPNARFIWRRSERTRVIYCARICQAASTVCFRFGASVCTRYDGRFDSDRSGKAYFYAR